MITIAYIYFNIYMMAFKKIHYIRNLGHTKILL